MTIGLLFIMLQRKVILKSSNYLLKYIKQISRSYQLQLSNHHFI